MEQSSHLVLQVQDSLATQTIFAEIADLADRCGQQAEDGSLLDWVCKHLSEKDLDCSGLVLAVRAFEVLEKSKPSGERTLSITCCNVTTWRTEVKELDHFPR